jgi:putative transposase
VSADGKTFVEATFADLRRPRISLWEQRMARKALRAAGSRDVSEELIFRTIERQRQIVRRAASETRRIRSNEAPARRSPRDIPWPEPAARAQPSPADVDYSKIPEDVHVEVW